MVISTLDERLFEGVLQLRESRLVVHTRRQASCISTFFLRSATSPGLMWGP
jgi:hypothetical protein